MDEEIRLQGAKDLAAVFKKKGDWWCAVEIDR
jgi:hypothetical protein